MYAHVLYQKDGIKKKVPAIDIKDFHPSRKTDYNPSTVVRVFWRGVNDEIPYEDARRYNAQILKLGGMFEKRENDIHICRLVV